MCKSNVAFDDFNKPQRRKTQEHGFCSRHVSGLIKSFTEDEKTVGHEKATFVAKVGHVTRNCKRLFRGRDGVSSNFFSMELSLARLLEWWAQLALNLTLSLKEIMLGVFEKGLRPLVNIISWAYFEPGQVFPEAFDIEWNSGLRISKHFSSLAQAYFWARAFDSELKPVPALAQTQIYRSWFFVKKN